MVMVWPHLGLGDTISSARSLEALSQDKKRVYVACRSVNRANLDFLFSYLPNVEFVSLSPGSERDEIRQVRLAAKGLQVPLLIGGHGLFFVIWENALTNLGWNGVLNACLGWTGKLESPQMRQHVIKNSDSGCVPQHPFAFVDHHPGTWREIPSARLAEVSSRLTVIHNSMSLSLAEVSALLQNATELHLVPSAPFCLALTCEFSGKLANIHHRIPGYAPIGGDYKTIWSSEDLSEQGDSIGKTPSQTLTLRVRLTRQLARLAIKAMFPYVPLEYSGEPTSVGKANQPVLDN